MVIGELVAFYNFFYLYFQMLQKRWVFSLTVLSQTGQYIYSLGRSVSLFNEGAICFCLICMFRKWSVVDTMKLIIIFFQFYLYTEKSMTQHSETCDASVGFRFQIFGGFFDPPLFFWKKNLEAKLWSIAKIQYWYSWKVSSSTSIFQNIVS